MCCFSGPVEKVEATNIHARMMGAARQLLVYEMRIAARAEVAMILPIPVPAGTAEDAVRFHSLEHYPTVFGFAPGTIDRVPAYADWGFAVFQLAPTKGLASVHPMAFDFPTREPSRLFFPTVHVHDGQLHAEAEFAHQLYAQGEPARAEDHREAAAHRGPVRAPVRWRCTPHPTPDLRHAPEHRYLGGAGRMIRQCARLPSSRASSSSRRAATTPRRA
jgi:hypothetical protein